MEKKGRVTAVALRENERASFFSFSVGPANSTDHTGVNPRFEYAWQFSFFLSLSLCRLLVSLSLGSKAYSPPSSPISLNPHSGFARYEINSHSELPLMSPKVSLTIGDARGARSSIYIYVCVWVYKIHGQSLYSFLLDSFTICKQMFPALLHDTSTQRCKERFWRNVCVKFRMIYVGARAWGLNVGAVSEDRDRDNVRERERESASLAHTRAK